MKTIELFGQVDESHRLSAQLPLEVPPGPVRFSISLPSVDARQGKSDDAGEADWTALIAREWSAELSDPREDIYTLSDGE